MRALVGLLVLGLATAAAAERMPAKCGRVVLARAIATRLRGGGVFAFPRQCPRLRFPPGIEATIRPGTTDVLDVRRGGQPLISVVTAVAPTPTPADEHYAARMLLLRRAAQPGGGGD